MQALVFNAASEELRLESRPVPVPAPGEALIRVTRAGVCSTVRAARRRPAGILAIEHMRSC